MTIHVTAGECLNELLREKYPSGTFVPFNEAMLRGTAAAPLFSDAFIAERAAALGVSGESYREKLSGFLDLLDRLGEYEEITLWFGDEPFCAVNRETVLRALRERGYAGEVILNTVEETSGEILRQKRFRFP